MLRVVWDDACGAGIRLGVGRNFANFEGQESFSSHEAQ
jgi:hypothetical protein